MDRNGDGFLTIQEVLRYVAQNKPPDNQVPGQAGGNNAASSTTSVRSPMGAGMSRSAVRAYLTRAASAKIDAAAATGMNDAVPQRGPQPQNFPDPSASPTSVSASTPPDCQKGRQYLRLLRCQQRHRSRRGVAKSSDSGGRFQ